MFSLRQYQNRLFLLAFLIVVSCAALPIVWQNAKGPITDSVKDVQNPYVLANAFIDSIMPRPNIAVEELDYKHRMTSKDGADLYKRHKILGVALSL